MSGRGKGMAKGTKSKSRSSPAGLQFPVGRIHRLLRKGNYAKRVGTGASVYLAAMLECLSAEISSWRAMLLVTTRKTESLPVTFSLLSATTKSWTNCSPASPSRKEVFFPTSRLFFCPRRPRRNQKPKQSYAALKQTALLGATTYNKTHDHKREKYSNQLVDVFFFE